MTQNFKATILSFIAWADPEGDRESQPHPPPLKTYKNIGFLCKTSPDPLKKHKATKAAFNVGPSSAHQRNAIYTMMAHFLVVHVFFESSIPTSSI